MWWQAFTDWELWAASHHTEFLEHIFDDQYDSMFTADNVYVGFVTPVKEMWIRDMTQKRVKFKPVPVKKRGKSHCDNSFAQEQEK